MENDLSVVSQYLDTRIIGRNVLYYPSVTSTMDVARQETRRGAVEGTVIIADEQTAGKGRIKRSWFTPGGNIALSIILYPGVSYLPYLIMLASLAVANSIETVTGLKTQIKWPNDILIGGKKVCGILVESDVREDVVAYAIIGIGINVDFRIADFPEIAATATSLGIELGRDVSRIRLLKSLLTEIDMLYASAGESIFASWQGRLVTLGKKVQVTSGSSIMEGVAESVDRDGSLMLRLAEGSVTRIIAGDVTLRESR